MPAGSSFERSRETYTSMAFGERSSPQPATAWMIASLETIFSTLPSSTSSTAHSRAASSSGSFLRNARRATVSSGSGPCTIAGPPHRTEGGGPVPEARPAMRLRAAQERAHARRELRHGERLDHVVVGAEVEAAHAILDRVARRQHQHRQWTALVAGGAQPAQHLEAVHLRQADVEDHQVEALLRSRQHRLLAARSDIHRVTLGLEDAAKTARERRVVFYDEQSQTGKCYDFPPP